MFIIIKDCQYSDNRLRVLDFPNLHFPNINSEEKKTGEFMRFCNSFVESYNGRLFTLIAFNNLFNDLWINRKEFYSK